MNAITDKTVLKNRYFTLRHGESTANVEQIVISDPKNGIPGFGLTEKGKKQVFDSITQQAVLDKNTLIFSSDFLRATQSAKIAQNVLGSEKIILTPLLRERFFGSFEKKDNSCYEKIWDKDKLDPNHNWEGVETAQNVQKRTTQLISDIEEKYTGKTVLLSSHGDALQILQTGFNKTSSALHRSVPHLENAEVRELEIL